MVDQGERIARLEEKFDGMEDFLRQNLEQLRKMHSDHYATNREHDKLIERVTGQVEAVDRHNKRIDFIFGEHISNHWKWIALLVPTMLGITGIIVGFLRK